jgi:hypothetical protein
VIWIERKPWGRGRPKLGAILFFDLDRLARVQFITTTLLIAFDNVARLGIDRLLFQPVAGFPVDHVEVGFVDGCRGRIERYRA